MKLVPPESDSHPAATSDERSTPTRSGTGLRTLETIAMEYLAFGRVHPDAPEHSCSDVLAPAPAVRDRKFEALAGRA